MNTKGRSYKYKVEEIKGTNDEKWAHLKECFPDDTADWMNLLMGSTDGIHGNRATLDNLEDPKFLEENEFTPDDDEAFTVLVVQPRMCRLQFATIGIRNKSDALWLRTVITDSIRVFAECQEGNTL